MTKKLGFRLMNGPKAQSSKFQKRWAFTLAEVLITLGIIGIVAEMTLPTLVNNVNETANLTGLKKYFSVLSQATLSVMTDNSGSMMGLCPDSDSNCLRNAYLPYLRTTKSCDNGTAGCFWHNEGKMKYLNGDVLSPWGADASVVMSDGALVDFWMMKSACTHSYGSPNDNCGMFFVDVNGTKPPNRTGKDIFIFHIKQDGISPAGGPLDTTDNYFAFECTVYGFSCANKLLYN